jgi:hypothetical protein
VTRGLVPLAAPAPGHSISSVQLGAGSHAFHGAAHRFRFASIQAVSRFGEAEYAYFYLGGGAAVGSSASKRLVEQPAPTCPHLPPVSARHLPPAPRPLKGGGRLPFEVLISFWLHSRRSLARRPRKTILSRARASWAPRPLRSAWCARTGGIDHESLRRRQRLGGPIPCRHGATQVSEKGLHHE